MALKPKTKTSSATSAARAESKKLKKNRRKIRKAEKIKLGGKGQQQELPTKWRRISKEDGCKKAVDWPMDEEMINKLLEKRSKFKLDKNYNESDKIAAKMLDMGVVYDDALKRWHARLRQA